jgi:hypothetical protein
VESDSTKLRRTGLLVLQEGENFADTQSKTNNETKQQQSIFSEMRTYFITATWSHFGL